MPEGPQSTPIAAWEDDPVAAIPEGQPPRNKPIRGVEPDFNPAGLPVGLAGPRPAPGIYQVGTADFRYWALADALARGARYWSGRMPAGTTWQPDNGNRLVAVPDEGVDLNAYYDRNGLHFFHGSVRGTTVYSGESPDVVCHELGHAVLDAVKPQLWDAASIEVAAFHESFGDISAILSNLQLASMRDEVLTETDGQVATASRLSRLAEDLGWAIRQLVPDAVSPDCLPARSTRCTTRLQRRCHRAHRRWCFRLSRTVSRGCSQPVSSACSAGYSTFSHSRTLMDC
jgi:hypothetical protein